MEVSMPPPVPSLAGASRMSLGARLANVFIGPGEVFEEVKQGPPTTANWLVPGLLLCLVGVISTFVLFSQDSILQQVKEQQEQALEKKLENAPKEQREQIRAIFEKFTSPALMRILGSGGAVVRGLGWLFFLAVVLWLLGTFAFKGSFTYMQSVEVCGLAAVISILGSIISTLLAVIMGNVLATPGPALFVRDLNISNPAHQLLSAFNVMSLWYVGVLAIGLAKLSGASVAKSSVCLFAIWAAISSAWILASWASQRLF